MNTSNEQTQELLTQAERRTLGENEKKKKIGLMVVGDTGVGKSSLINLIFGEKVCEIGVGDAFGRPHTFDIKNVDEYLEKHCYKNCYFFDTKGVEQSESVSQAYQRLLSLIKMIQKRVPVHCIIYCFSCVKKVEEKQIQLIKKLRTDLLKEKNISILPPGVIVTVTKCDLRPKELVDKKIEHISHDLKLEKTKILKISNSLSSIKFTQHFYCEDMKNCIGAMCSKVRKGDQIYYQCPNKTDHIYRICPNNKCEDPDPMYSEKKEEYRCNTCDTIWKPKESYSSEHEKLRERILDFFKDVKLITLFINALPYKTPTKRIAGSVTTIIACCTANGAIAASPIPFSDWPLLVVFQVSMAGILGAIWGLPVKAVKYHFWNFLAGSTALLGGFAVGKTIATIIKFIPAVGTIGGAILDSTISITITAVMGIIMTSIFASLFRKYNGDYSNLTYEEFDQTIKNHFSKEKFDKLKDKFKRLYKKRKLKDAITTLISDDMKLTDDQIAEIKRRVENSDIKSMEKALRSEANTIKKK